MFYIEKSHIFADKKYNIMMKETLPLSTEDIVKGVKVNDRHNFHSEALYAGQRGGDVMRGYIVTESSLSFDTSGLDKMTVIGKKCMFDKDQHPLVLDFYHRFGLRYPNEIFRCDKKILALL